MLTTRFGESVPDAPPAVVSNTGAAVAAYAGALTDGPADEVRRGISHAIWVQGAPRVRDRAAFRRYADT